MAVIYKITNTVNSKAYVGQTRHTASRRWNAHIADCRRGVITPLYHAMRHHGIDYFEIEVIETVEDVVDLNAREIFWISELRTHLSAGGYNATWGGRGGFHKSDVGTRKARAHSQATKEKLSQAHRNKTPSESLLTYWESKRGKPVFDLKSLSPAARDTMRVRMQAAWTPERRAKLGQVSREKFAGTAGRTQTNAAKEKLRGRIVSESTKAKLREIGLRHRDATAQRMKETMRKRMAEKTPEERSALARIAQRASVEAKLRNRLVRPSTQSG